MAGRISEQDIQAVRERADLATVVRAYTSLTAAGSRLKGLCPFHSEKTPSFTVDPAQGVYHCFGCQEGGDVFTFVERVEALSFPEAVERLARMIGYELRYEQLTPGQRKAIGRRTRLGDVVREAARLYAERLRTGDDAAPARAYLAGRGVDADAAAHFGLGWAPDAWDTVSRLLLDAGFAPDEVIDAGLATAGQRGPTDRFRGRVLFPILDAGGRDVIAFGGRVLPGVTLRTGPRDGTPPKYVNSPETEVYKKSKTLYALNWARAEVQRRQTALVVEGYMDVIGLHLAGVRHVVATCGTALTAEHFRLLEKHASRVILALDADDAGMAAAEKARALSAEVGVRELGVLPLPPGEDPADLAAAGHGAVERALDGVVTAVHFQIEHLMRTADLVTPEGQVAAYRRTFPLLLDIPDRVLRYRYVRDVVAPKVRLSSDLIERELDAEAPARERVEVTGPGLAAPGRPGDVGAAGQRDPRLRLERWILQIALQRPQLLDGAELAVSEFRFPAAQQLWAAIGGAGTRELEAVLADLPDDDMRARARALALGELEVDPADVAHVAELVSSFREGALRARSAEVAAELARLHPSADADRHRALRLEGVDLQRRLHELRRREAS